MSSIYVQLAGAIEKYLAQQYHVLSPVEHNLQTPSSSPSGEIVFPLCLMTHDFDHWTTLQRHLGAYLLIGLIPVIRACDELFKNVLGIEYQYCKDWIQRQKALPSSPERQMNFIDSCFWTLKLSVNVAQDQVPLSCGHESPLCAVMFLGDYTADIVVFGNMLLEPTVGAGFLVNTALPVTIEKLKDLCIG
jgi:hypothetical protein